MAHGRGPMFKVVLTGEVGVGKTSLFYRLSDDTFSEFVPNTSGIDSCSKVMMIGDTRVSFSVWDTAGVERFRTLTHNYYRNANVVILMYSLSEPSSLDYLPKWVDDANYNASDALKVLIGNKSDAISRIKDERADDFASVYDCDLAFKISAKTGKGIDECMAVIAQKILKEQVNKEERQNKSNIILGNSTDSDISRNKSCSC